MAEMAENIRTDTGWRVPVPQWPLVAGRAMCAEWIDGMRVEACRTIVRAGLDVRSDA